MRQFKTESKKLLDLMINSIYTIPSRQSRAGGYARSTQQLVRSTAFGSIRREQIARLIAICIFKQVLPIAAVQALFNIQRLSYDAPTAFDYVVDQLEASIRAAFSVEQTPVPDTAHQVTRESLLVRSAVSSFVSKAYLMSYLKFNGFNS